MTSENLEIGTRLAPEDTKQPSTVLVLFASSCSRPNGRLLPRHERRIWGFKRAWLVPHAHPAPFAPTRGRYGALLRTGGRPRIAQCASRPQRRSRQTLTPKRR